MRIEINKTEKNKYRNNTLIYNIFVFPFHSYTDHTKTTGKQTNPAKHPTNKKT